MSGSVVLDLIDEINEKLGKVDVRDLGPDESIYETFKNFTDVVTANDEEKKMEKTNKLVVKRVEKLKCVLSGYWN